MAEEHDESTAEESASDTGGSNDRRHAARVATWVAIPVTLAAGAGALTFANSIAPADDGARDDAGGSSQGPVEMSLPDLSEDDATICRALVSVLPEELGSSPRRPVTGDEGAAEVAAAWGDPAVQMRCGVDDVDVAQDAEVFRLGPACWATTEDDDHTVWTTVDRELPIELTIPPDHAAPGELAQGLSEAVDEKVPASESAPTGCSG